MVRRAAAVAKPRETRGTARGRVVPRAAAVDEEEEQEMWKCVTLGYRLGYRLGHLLEVITIDSQPEPLLFLIPLGRSRKFCKGGRSPAKSTIWNSRNLENCPKHNFSKVSFMRPRRFYFCRAGSLGIRVPELILEHI